MAIPFRGFTPPPYTLTSRRQFLDLSQMAEGLEGGFKFGRDLKNEREAGQLAEEWINAGMGGAPGGSFLGDMAGVPSTDTALAQAIPGGRERARLRPSEHATPELARAIQNTANKLGIDPVDLATVISYETGGTFDPWKAGPTTKWGQHRGLIQWGEPQARQYGVYEGMPLQAQMDAAGRYLVNAGVKPGMGLMDIYSAVNAGRVGRYNASDRPGHTVRSHVAGMQGGHRNRAMALMALAADETQTPRVRGAAAQAAEAVATGQEIPPATQDALASALPLGLNRNTVATIQGRSAPIIAQPDRFTRGSRPPPDAVAAQPDRYTPGQRPGAEALQTLPERRSSVRRVQTTRFDANGNPVAEAGEVAGGSVAGGGEGGIRAPAMNLDQGPGSPRSIGDMIGRLPPGPETRALNDHYLNGPSGMDRGRFDAADLGEDGLITPVSPDEFVQYLQTITIRNGQVEEGTPPPVPAGIGGRFADAFGPSVPPGIGQRFDDAFAPAAGPAAVAAREAPAVQARGVPAVPGREAAAVPAAERTGAVPARMAAVQPAVGMDVPPVPRPNPGRNAPQIATEAPPAPAADPGGLSGTPVSAPPVAPSPAALGGRPVSGRYSPEQVAILARMARNPLTRDFALKIAAEHMAPDDFEYFEVGGQIVAVNKRTGQAAPIFGEPAAAEREIREDSRGVARYVDTGEPVFPDDEPPAEAPDLVTLYDEQGREYKAFYDPSHPDADERGYVAVGGSKAQRGTITRINPQTGELEIIEGADLTPATRSGVQQEVISAEDALVRLENIESAFKPEYATFWGSAANAARAWRAYLFNDVPVLDQLFGLSDEAKAQLAEYATWRTRTANNLNQYLHDMSGAAINAQEAQRLIKELPSDQDDPITFKAKLDEVIRQTKEAIARNQQRLGQANPDAGVGTIKPPAPDRPPPPGISQEDWEWMTPEERSGF